MYCKWTQILNSHTTSISGKVTGTVNRLNILEKLARVKDRVLRYDIIYSKDPSLRKNAQFECSVSVMYRSSIGQVSVMYRSSIGEVSVKYRWSIGQVSVKYRSSIGQVPVKYRSCIGQVSVEYRWFKTILVDTFIGRLSNDRRSTVDRWSTDSRRPIPDISADVSADMSTESTYSTHDPVNLMAHFILWDENSASEDEIYPTDTCKRALLL